MHSAYVFLNTGGGWLIFGVAPKVTEEVNLRPAKL